MAFMIQISFYISELKRKKKKKNHQNNFKRFYQIVKMGYDFITW